MSRFTPLLIVAATAAGCGRATATSPTAPSALAGTQIVRLTISGPSTIAPGSSAQFRASRTSADGTAVDVTSAVAWRSDRPEVVEIDGRGHATARTAGEVVVYASVQDQSASAAVTALSDGRFKLSGMVLERGAKSFGLDDAIPGAVVEITKGEGAGRRAATDATGAYAIYDLAGPVEIRFSAAGYTPQTFSLNITSSRTWSASMIPSAGVPSMAGSWTTTFSIDRPCAGFPANTQTRTFFADISHVPDNVVFDMRIKNAMPPVLDAIQGLIVRGEILLDFFHAPGNDSDPIFGATYYTILEPLQPAGFLGIWGQMRARFDTSKITTTFSGGFDYYPIAIGPGLATNCDGQVTAVFERR